VDANAAGIVWRDCVNILPRAALDEHQFNDLLDELAFAVKSIVSE
jgi:hypothetical protein